MNVNFSNFNFQMFICTYDQKDPYIAADGKSLEPPVICRFPIDTSFLVM